MLEKHKVIAAALWCHLKQGVGCGDMEVLKIGSFWDALNTRGRIMIVSNKRPQYGTSGTFLVAFLNPPHIPALACADLVPA